MRSRPCRSILHHLLIRPPALATKYNTVPRHDHGLDIIRPQQLLLHTGYTAILSNGQPGVHENEMDHGYTPLPARARSHGRVQYTLEPKYRLQNFEKFKK